MSLSWRCDTARLFTFRNVNISKKITEALRDETIQTDEGDDGSRVRSGSEMACSDKRAHPQAKLYQKRPAIAVASKKRQQSHCFNITTKFLLH